MINLNISLPAGPSKKAADWCGPSVRVNVRQSDSSRLFITEVSLVEVAGTLILFVERSQLMADPSSARTV